MNLVLPLLMLSSSASSSMCFSMRSDSFHSSACAVGRQHLRPGARLERGARGGHGAIDVGCVGIGDGGDLAARGRVDHGDALLGFRLDPFPADEQAGCAFEEFRHRRGRLRLRGDLGVRGLSRRSRWEPPDE